MQDIHSKCWFDLVSVRNNIFTLFVQLVCNKYFVTFLLFSEKLGFIFFKYIFDLIFYQFHALRFTVVPLEPASSENTEV